MKNGEQVTFYQVPPLEPVVGYLGGLDRYNYVVLSVETGTVTKYILHKGSTPRIEFDTGYRPVQDQSGAIQDELEKVLAPFREHVMRQYFNQLPPRPRSPR